MGFFPDTMKHNEERNTVRNMTWCHTIRYDAIRQETRRDIQYGLRNTPCGTAQVRFRSIPEIHDIPPQNLRKQNFVSLLETLLMSFSLIVIIVIRDSAACWSAPPPPSRTTVPLNTCLCSCAALHWSHPLCNTTV